MTLQAGELPGGKLRVEIRGLDVYDPTTGEIRSSSTDDIACWFEGSDYNEESFSDEPYKKLQRALKAEIEEDAWGEPLQHRQPPLLPTVDRQDRREGDQSLWR
jgi:adenine-specific DNA-methyltransferase